MRDCSHALMRRLAETNGRLCHPISLVSATGPGVQLCKRSLRGTYFSTIKDLKIVADRIAAQPSLDDAIRTK